MDWWNWIFSVFSSFLTQVPLCRCQRTKGCVSSHLTIPFENCLLSRKQSFFTAHFPLLDFGVPVCVIQLTFRLHHFLAWKVVIVRSFGFSSCSASPALVDLHRRPLSHLIGDVRIGVQRGSAGYMSQNGGQSFDVHAVGQRGVAKVCQRSWYLTLSHSA